MKDKIYLFVGGICLICVCVSSYFLFQYYAVSNSQENQYDAIAKIYHETEQQIPDEHLDVDSSAEEAKVQESKVYAVAELQKINPDCVGFITINDTTVDYPIVQKDNSYYLNHNFMNESASAGAIFLDEKCDVADDLLLIHGHHMKSGAMFGALKNYKKENFRNEHKTILFDDGTEKKEYRIFGVAMVDLTKDNYFHYDEIPSSLDEKKTYINTFLKTAIWKDAGLLDSEFEKKMILLSTCEYGTQDQRLVVLAIED